MSDEKIVIYQVLPRLFSNMCDTCVPNGAYVQNGAGKDGDFAVFGSSILLSRMEDMLLLRAEALAVLNRVDDAVEQLNLLRVKRGLSQVSFKKNFGEDVNKLIDNIFAERRRELIG